MGAWPHHLSWFNNRASPPSKYTRAQCTDTTQRRSHTAKEKERDGWRTLFSCSCSPMAMLSKSCQSSRQSADAARRSPPGFTHQSPVLFSLPPTLLLTLPFCSPSVVVSSQFSAAAHKSPRSRHLSASAAPTCILNGFSFVCACVYAEKNSPAPLSRS